MENTNKMKNLTNDLKAFEQRRIPRQTSCFRPPAC